MNMRVVVAAAVGLIGGYVSGCAIACADRAFAVVASGSGWLFPPEPVYEATGAAVVAVLTIALISRFAPRRIVVAVAGSVGIVLLVAGAGTAVEQRVVVAVGAGLVIGAAVLPVGARVWFVAGSLIAVLYGERLEVDTGMPERYADYLEAPSTSGPAVSWAVLVALVAALVVYGFRGPAVDAEATGRGVLTGIAVPLSLAVSVAVTAQAGGDPAVAVATVAVIALVALSFRLPRQDGTAVLTVLAVAAMLAVDSSAVSGPDRLGASAQIGLVVVGVLIGVARRRPLTGILGCGVVTVSGLLPAVVDSTTLTDLTFRFVLPAVAGFAIGTCFPAAPTTAVTAFAVLFVATLLGDTRFTGGSESGWTAYVPDTYSPALDSKTPVVIATAVIVGCALLVWRRHAPDEQGTPHR
ncbi:hypothetical protein [Nocardia sp. NPDC023988]|uniref:hypothetical protein n=1 Tax=unclassified Nocardia TaxID=2637762 RepID=UPI0034020070